jgi:hypothetical protein
MRPPGMSCHAAPSHPRRGTMDAAMEPTVELAREAGHRAVGEVAVHDTVGVFVPDSMSSEMIVWVRTPATQPEPDRAVNAFIHRVGIISRCVVHRLRRINRASAQYEQCGAGHQAYKFHLLWRSVPFADWGRIVPPYRCTMPRFLVIYMGRSAGCANHGACTGENCSASKSLIRASSDLASAGARIFMVLSK